VRSIIHKSGTSGLGVINLARGWTYDVVVKCAYKIH